MAIYLKPRRGAQATAKDQNIGLKKGEIFLEFPEGRIGREPGRIVIGDGATSYDHINYGSTSTNEFQPFITDPSIYTPRFVNTSTSTGEGQINPAFESINKIGNGSTVGEKLPTIIGAIKETLIYHANSLSETYKKFTSGFDIYGNGTTHSVGATDVYDWTNSDVHYKNEVSADKITLTKSTNDRTDYTILDGTENKLILDDNLSDDSRTKSYASISKGQVHLWFRNGVPNNASTVTNIWQSDMYSMQFESSMNATSVSKVVGVPYGISRKGNIIVNPAVDASTSQYQFPYIQISDATTYYAPGPLEDTRYINISPRDIIKSKGWGGSAISSLTDWVISRTSEFITKSNEDLSEYINFTNLLPNIGDVAYINAIAIPSREITITDNSYAGALIYAVRKSESAVNAFIMNSIVAGDYEVGSWRVVTNNVGTIGIILEVQSVYAPISATAMVIHSN